MIEVRRNPPLIGVARITGAGGWDVGDALASGADPVVAGRTIPGCGRMIKAARDPALIRMAQIAFGSGRQVSCVLPGRGGAVVT